MCVSIESMKYGYIKHVSGISSRGVYIIYCVCCGLVRTVRARGSPVHTESRVYRLPYCYLANGVLSCRTPRRFVGQSLNEKGERKPRRSIMGYDNNIVVRAYGII